MYPASTAYRRWLSKARDNASTVMQQPVNHAELDNPDDKSVLNVPVSPDVLVIRYGNNIWLRADCLDCSEPTTKWTKLSDFQCLSIY